MKRHDVVKWVTLALGLIIAVMQLIIYALIKINPKIIWTETDTYFSYAAMFLIIAPYSIPKILLGSTKLIGGVSNILSKFTNKK